MPSVSSLGMIGVMCEARNNADEEFGLLRLIDACAGHQNVDALLTGVMGAVRNWSEDCEQGDDITLVALAAGDE